jgi:hypothetical protein
MGQEKDYEWFKDHKKEIFEKYSNKFVVISKESVIYASETFQGSLDYARKNLGMGNFLIQQAEEEMQNFYCYNHVMASL